MNPLLIGIKNAAIMMLVAVTFLVLLTKSCSAAEAGDLTVEAHAAILLQEAGIDPADVDIKWGGDMVWSGDIARAYCLPRMTIYILPQLMVRTVHVEVLPHEIAHLVICARYGTMGAPQEQHNREWTAAWEPLYISATARKTGGF